MWNTNMSIRRVLTSVESTGDKNVVDSLYEFIEKEKKQLGCPENGPDERRYVVYTSAFDKVIEHAGTYKTVLSAIKREYDSLITSIKRRNQDERFAQGKLKARTAEATSLKYYQRRSAQLRDRIEIIQRDSSEVQNELAALRSPQTEEKPFQNQVITDHKDTESIGQIPGLEFQDSLDPAISLEHFNQKCTELPSERVKADLATRMKSTLDQKDMLLLENERLRLRNKEMKFISDALSSWEKSGRTPPLTDFLDSVLHKIMELKAFDSDSDSTISEEFEEELSTEDRSDLLLEYTERFSDLFECGEYKAAVFLAAECPLRDFREVETVDKFKLSREILPPLLQHVQAFMALVLSGNRLPSDGFSVEAVKCALQYGHVELVTHWVTQKRLTCCEVLGDVIRAHQPSEPREADICLALAQMVYSACGARGKAAACLCDRGMVHAAVELIHLDRAFTVDDCLYMLKSCPSLELIQGLTQEHQGHSAILSVGFTTHTLLNTDCKDLAFQLLENIHHRGAGALQDTILTDSNCTAEEWGEIAGHCMQQDRRRLAQDILSILTAQPGTVLLSPGAEGVELMEHVFM